MLGGCLLLVLSSLRICFGNKVRCAGRGCTDKLFIVVDPYT